MSRSGTNNGGGPRWGSMPRETCPLCGLTRPVGVTQGDRRFECRNKAKCDERRKRRVSKPKGGA